MPVYHSDKALSAELRELCRQHGVVPLRLSTDTLTIAVSMQHDPERDKQLSFASGCHIEHQIWPAARLEAELNPLHASHHGQTYQESGLHGTTHSVPLKEPAGHYASSTYHAFRTHYPADTVPASPAGHEGEAPVIQFIDQVIDSAIQRRASDIHFEPDADRLQIRLRIDGVLQPLYSTADISAVQIVARLKIISQLDIAERRLPQDGQFTVERQQHRFPLRIATLPTQYGEKVVLRLQESGQQTPSLPQLGFSEQQLQLYRQALSSPQGLILVTGPTGSGKTVTLYSGLKELDKVARNICSVEDPIELPLSGINQTAINPKCGLTFAKVLRALLRQDPDVIMVGEIRDEETADIATNAAQTGHLVLSTLHSNSACDALIRLQQMGIPAWLIASSLKLVIAQRLLRRLCSHCKQPLPEEQITVLPSWQGSFSAWQAKGCQHCFSGYYGRTGLYEVLPISRQIQHTLLAEHTVSQIETIAGQEGLQPLWHAGLHLVNQGITSQEELFRVVSAC